MLLVIETATAACSVALFDGPALVAAMHETVGRGHAERLLPMIAALPGGGRADEILVDCGPGSFTGIRVGLAAARGLGLGWNVPVHGYSGLDVIAVRSRRAPAVVATMPGGHGEVFARHYPGADVVNSLTPDALPAFAGGHAIVTDESAFDARNALVLDVTERRRPPRPIYGRAPDAKPLA